MAVDEESVSERRKEQLRRLAGAALLIGAARGPEDVRALVAEQARALVGLHGVVVLEHVPATELPGTALPLLAPDGRSLGCLVVPAAGLDELDDGDRAVLSQLAQLAAVAMENMRLRRSAEESLAQLETLLASAPIGIGFWDANFRYLRINEALAAINGVPAETSIGRTLEEVLPELAATITPLWRRVLETGEPILDVELSGETPAAPGEERSWLVSYYPVRGVDGEVAGIGAIVSEITERRAREAELARRVDELAGIYDLADAVARAPSLDHVFEAALDALERAVGVPRAAVVLFDESGAIHFRAWRGLSGAYRDAVEGRSPWRAHVGSTDSMIVGDVLADPEVADLHDAFRRERIASMALVPLVHAGVVLGRFVLYSDRPHAFAQGDVKLAEAIASHVAAATERRRVEEDLRRSRNELSAIFGSVADGITAQDASGRIVYANDAAARMIGFGTAEELLGSASAEIAGRFEILDEKRRPLPFDELPGRVALATGRAVERTLCYRSRDTEEERWSVVRAAPVVEEDGRVRLAISAFHDVTEGKRAEQRLRFLGEASRRLATSLDVEETLAQIGRLAVPALADYCLVDLFERDGSLKQVLRVHVDAERDRALAEIRERYPPFENPAHPVSRVLATGEPVVETSDPDRALDVISLDATHRRLYETLGPTSFLAAPLVAHGERLGAISMGTSRPRPPLDETTIELALGLADRAATAVANARLYREAEREVAERERAEGRIRFLGEASRLLAESLDVESTLAEIAQLALPVLADYCLIDLVDEDGRLDRVVMSHVDPGGEEVLRELRERFPPDFNEAHPASRVLATGQPLVFEDVTRDVLAEASISDEHLEHYLRLEPCSYMVVPLTARGRRLGTLSFGTSVSGRRYGAEELVLARELADRAAVAVDNALLYRRATETVAELRRNEETLRLLSQASELLAASLDHSETLQAVAELAVAAFADGCSIYLAEGDELRRLASSHSDPGQAAVVAALDRGLPLDRDDHPLVGAFHAGEPVLVPKVERETIRSLALEPAERELVERLQPASALVVPLVTRGVRRGVAVFTSLDHAYTDADLALAIELARRMSVALDRTALYREASESLALLDTLFATAPVGLAFYDAELRYVRVNAALAQINGLPVEEHLGRPVTEVLPDLGPEVKRVCDEVLATGRPKVGMEVTGETPAAPGETRHWLADYYPVLGPDGEILGLGAVVTEITERKRAEETVSFLGEASALLASSLDVETTLENVAELAVPRLADWCSIVLVQDDGSLRTVAVAHEDPERARWARDLHARYPGPPPRVASVIRRREPELLSDIPHELIVKKLRGHDELVAAYSGLRLRSALFVPLLSRGRAIGALALLTSDDSGRTLGPEDLSLASELARRAAIAVENARLFQALEHQSRLTATITDTAAAALFLLDADGYATYLNPAAVAITGWTLKELDGRRLHDVLHHTRPDGSAYPFEECPITQALVESRTLKDYEDRFVRRDGGFFDVRCSASPIVRGGVREGALLELLDITEERRVRAEADARAQAAQALEFVGDGVFLVDAHGLVRLWNPAAARITGLAEEDVVGEHAHDALAGWPLGELGPRAETRPVELGDRELWLSLSADSFPEGTVYAFRDLTEEYAIERLKTDFVSTVSHELRTPLAAIYGAAMTLQRSDVVLAETQREGLLSVVASESERLARIVNDVLWASRLDSGVMDVSIESCDALVLAEAVTAAARTHLPAGIDLAVEAPASLPPVAADPDKVRQVLVNLVDNAIKYSPDGGDVRVRLSAGEHALRFVVSDEGLGIPVSEQGRIFEKFFRLDPDLTRGVGGTGLGLYICRELVRRMHGRIWVESGEGRGSTFVVELPLAR